MRPLKFRAWIDTTQCEKVDDKLKSKGFINSEDHWGSMVKPFCMKMFWQTIENYHSWTGVKIDIQQFTGLFDKNSKEIYEGDIFRMTNVTDEELDSIENKFIVYFGEFGEKWRNSRGMAGIGFYTKSIYVYHKKTETVKSLCNAKNEFNREIIGNIWEHPNLLESK